LQHDSLPRRSNYESSLSSHKALAPNRFRVLMDSPIATLELVEVAANGARTPIHIEVGRPYHDPRGPWRCSILAGGIDREARDIFGEDSLQALSLGLEYLRTRLHFVLQRGGRLVDPEENGLSDRCIFQNAGVTARATQHDNEGELQGG
jgi:hypothetical protein